MGTKRILSRSCTAILFLLLLFFMALLLADTQLAVAGVGRGLSLCTETLFPSLFPFLVLSELLVARRVINLPKKAFSRPVAALLGISDSGTSALLMGMLCGSPVGTVTATALYRQGGITREELGRLILFVNNPSSGFLVGAVGGVMLGNVRAGVALFLITWLSALTVGVLWRLLRGAVPRVEGNYTKKSPQRSVMKDLTDSVSRGFASLLQIFAFVIFFSCVATCANAVLRALGAPDALCVLLDGLLEMTAGISQAVSLLSPEMAFRFAAILAGFSGFSVCLQVFSTVEAAGLSPLPYLLSKVLQGGLSLLFAEVYLRLFHPCLTATQNVATFADISAGQAQLQTVLFLLTALLCLPLLLRTRKKRRENPPLN